MKNMLHLIIPAIVACSVLAGSLVYLRASEEGEENLAVNFSVNPSYLIYLLDEQIQFVPQTSGRVSEYEWDFGDGNKSTEQSPVHAYSQPGEYLVTLNVTDKKGRKATCSQTLKVVGPSRVEIKELENGKFILLVNGQPFTIKGVCYSPTPIGKSPATGYNWWKDPATYLNDFPMIKEMGANTIRTYGSDATREALDYAYVNGIYVIMGHWVNYYLDLSIESNRNSEIEKYLRFVRAWKNHPAVLMWSFGNEVEYNYLSAGSGRKLVDWYTLLEEACRRIKEEDNLHPVTYSHIDRLGPGGIGDKSLKADDESLRSLDIWSLNVYRGSSFGNLFEEYARYSRKPLILSEFGCDALNGSLGVEDQATQASYIRNLWLEIKRKLAPAGICLGGTVFEWSDEWWKAGRPSSQENTAQWRNVSYGDPNMNEEWWGITSISDGGYLKTPRQAYYVLKELWTESSI
ncbi:MAG: PKD domain-containing protein [Candidatus Hadarchaeales archaeon]